MKKETKFLKSIKSKLIATIILAIVVTVAVSLAFIIPNVRSSLSGVTQNYMKDMAISYGTLLNEKLADSKDGTMSADECASLLKDVGVRDVSSSYAYLVSSDGTMIYHPTADKIGKPVENSVVKEIVAELAGGTVPQPDVISYAFKGEMKYASYYVTQNGGHDILVITADEKDILAPLNNITLLSLLAALIGAVLAVIIGIISAGTIIKPIKKITGVIDRVADLDFTIDSSLEELSRQQSEVGTMARSVDKLAEHVASVVEEVKAQSNSLANSSGQLDESAENTAATIEQVEKAVGEIAQGATNQAQETQRATENVILIGNMVEETNTEVDKLLETASVMFDAGKQADTALHELNDINQKAGSAIDVIYEQTHHTNESAMKIREVTELIASIAEETNLLSLNASIEAARAGEQGRGFAVVASQIQKLADQSNSSASQIAEIINLLIADSENAVNTMNEVKEIIAKQNEHVNKTQENFVNVKSGIEQSTESVNTIAEKVKKLDEARVEVVDVVQSLTAIAQENAASTEETSASVTQVSSIITDMADNAHKLEAIAASLEDTMKTFKVE